MVDDIVSEQDIFWMHFAIRLAKTAGEFGEVPVGAVIVNSKDQILGTGFNLKHSTHNVTHHAEILAITQACAQLSNWRLLDTRLYVTLEPCLMCSGAIYQARIKKVFFSTFDPKAGAMGSLYNIAQDNRLNHLVQVQEGLLKEESSTLLKDFFKKKRKENNKFSCIKIS